MSSNDSEIPTASASTESKEVDSNTIIGLENVLTDSDKNKSSNVKTKTKNKKQSIPNVKTRRIKRKKSSHFRFNLTKQRLWSKLALTGSQAQDNESTSAAKTNSISYSVNQSTVSQASNQQKKKSLAARIIQNGILSLFCVKKYRQKNLSVQSAEGQKAVQDLVYLFSLSYNYFLYRQIPEIMPVFRKLSFAGDAQIEADGLNSISAQVWIATFLLAADRSVLSENLYDLMRSRLVNMTWEAEKLAIFVRERYYRLLESFKRKVYPLLIILEQKAKAQKSQLDVDWDLADFDFEDSALDPPIDFKVLRPLDFLYLSPEYKISKPLAIVVNVKKSAKQSSELTIFFKDFPQDVRIETILNLYDDITRRLKFIYKQLKFNEERLVTELLRKHAKDELTCVAGFQQMVSKTEKFFQDYAINPVVFEQIENWILAIGKEVRNYFGYAEWAADKCSELQGMIQLCYHYANQKLEMNLPPYREICTEVGFDFLEKGRGHKPKMLQGSEGSSTASSTTGTSVTDSKIAKIGSIPRLTKILKKIQLMQPLQSSEFDEGDFFMSEYPKLLSKIPVVYNQTNFYVKELERV